MSSYFIAILDLHVNARKLHDTLGLDLFVIKANQNQWVITKYHSHIGAIYIYLIHLSCSEIVCIFFICQKPYEKYRPMCMLC